MGRSHTGIILVAPIELQNTKTAIPDFPAEVVLVPPLELQKTLFKHIIALFFFRITGRAHLVIVDSSFWEGPGRGRFICTSSGIVVICATTHYFPSAATLHLHQGQLTLCTLVSPCFFALVILALTGESGWHEWLECKQNVCERKPC